jgi:tetratricopeptide (TPR) repeat protein
LLVPPRAAVSADSVVETEPAPLLVPGRPSPADTAVRSRAQRARDYVAAGRSLERDRSPAAAIAAYRNAVMLDPKVPDAYARLGALFLEAGELEEARQCFVAELTNHPGNTEAGRSLGLVLARTGDHEHAIQQLRLLTRRDPGDAASWEALGFAYVAARRPKDAEAALRRALRLTPNSASAWRDLGAVLGAQGRTAEAREAYRRAAQRAPRDPSIPFNLGNLERRVGRLEPALEAYRRAESVDSTFTIAIQGQIQVLDEQRRTAEAGAAYRRLLRVRPDDHATRLEAVRLFGGLGRHDIAMEIARDGVRAAPRSPDAHVILGLAHGASGRTREALEEMRLGQTLYRSPDERARIDSLVAALRAGAPDSLRALFAADSVARARAPRPVPAGPDSLP